MGLPRGETGIGRVRIMPGNEPLLSRRAQFLEFDMPVQFIDLKYQGNGDAEQMPSIM